MNKKSFILSVLILAVALAVGFGTVATGAEQQTANVHSTTYATTYANTYAKPELPKKPRVKPGYKLPINNPVHNGTGLIGQLTEPYPNRYGKQQERHSLTRDSVPFTES